MQKSCNYGYVADLYVQISIFFQVPLQIHIIYFKLAELFTSRHISQQALGKFKIVIDELLTFMKSSPCYLVFGEVIQTAI